MQRLQIPETYDQAQLEAALKALGITDINRVLRVVLKPDVLEVTVAIWRKPAYMNVKGEPADDRSG